MRKFIVGMLTAITLTLPATAQFHASEIDDLKARLPESASATDSIRILYDIYDLSDRSSRADISWQLLDIAERTGNDDVALDMLRHLANIYLRNDSILAILENKCTAFPYSDNLAATEAFIALRRAGYIARYASEEERLAKIKDAISQYKSMPDEATPYQRIERLGTICILLGNSTHMATLAKYIDKSLEMAKELPPNDFAVRNIIYNQAAAVYTNLSLTDKAIIANRDLLDIMDRMTDYYHNTKGRPYRNYDTIRYATFRSLLQNYAGLSQKEIQQYYDSINSIAARNSDVANDLQNNIAYAYYLMGKKQYAEAIPLLETIVDSHPDNFNVMRAMHNIITAAGALGDNETLLKYTTMYNKKLEDYTRLAAQDTYAELQTLYDVNELQMRNARLELEHVEAKMQHQRMLLVGGIILFIAMIAVIFILFKLMKRSRNLAAGLARSNDALKKEQSNLLVIQQKLIDARDAAKRAEHYKSEFIDNMTLEITNPLNAIVEYSHLIVDCADNDKKKYLQRYADIVKLNTELLNTVIHDLLDLGSLENATLTIKRLPVQITTICNMAVESARPHMQPGVTMTFEHGKAAETYITTDATRVEQVLIHLLSNAAKFTPEGAITLSYSLDRNNNSVTFAVTDTGIGIPEGKEEVIFDRFRQLDRNTQGSGLGLPICRMIADLLGGSVTVDRTYDLKGSRFLFTIPIS